MHVHMLYHLHHPVEEGTEVLRIQVQEYFLQQIFTVPHFLIHRAVWNSAFRKTVRITLGFFEEILPYCLEDGSANIESNNIIFITHLGLGA